MHNIVTVTDASSFKVIFKAGLNIQTNHSGIQGLAKLGNQSID